MNILRASAGDILASIGKVAGIVPAKSTHPAISNILISKAGDTIRLIGTDTDVQVQVDTSLGGDEGRASTTVAASRLMPLLRSMSADQVVTLAMDVGKLTLRAGKSRFTLQTLPAEGFPLFREGNTTATMNLRQDALIALIDHTHFANDGRHQQPHFNGTLLSFEQDKITAVASDGLRMASYSLPRIPSSELSDVQTILPRKSMLELRKLLSSTDDFAIVSISPTHARFEFGDTVFLTKVIGTKYPDYRRVMGIQLDKAVTINRVALLGLMKRCQVIMADERNPGAYFKFSNGLLDVTTKSHVESGEQQLDVDYSGEEVTIGLPISQVMDGLSNFPHEVVTIRFESKDKPVIMSYSEAKAYQYMISAMRI